MFGSRKHLLRAYCTFIPSAVRLVTLPKKVQDVLNVQEVEFHRCFGGNRLLSSEA